MKKLVRPFVLLLVSGALLRFPAPAPASALDDLTDAAGRGLPDVPEPPAPTPADDDGYAARRERYRQMQEEEEREKEARRQQWEQEARERQERDERERQERDAREQQERDRQDEMRRGQQRRDQENQYNRQREDEQEADDRQADYRRQEQQQLQAQQQRRDQEERDRQEALRRQQAERERQERLRQEQLARERREQEERARQEALRRQQEEEARQARLRAQAAAARTQWAADDERYGSAFDDIFAGAAGTDPNTVDLTTTTGRTPAILRGSGSPVSLRVKPPPVPRPEVTIELREDPPEPPPRWHVDLKSKLTDLGFAYVSMYLKSKVDGLASIPELTKDAFDLHKRLREHTTGYLDKLFTTAGQAADRNADLGALSDRTWANFQTAASNYDEDARRGMQNNVATTSSGALPEGSHAAEVGIGQGQAQLQDTQELTKWCEEHRNDRR